MRILIASRSKKNAARAAALVRACELESPVVTSQLYADSASFEGPEAFDVAIICGQPGDEAEAERLDNIIVSLRSIPFVLLGSTLSLWLSGLSHRLGASVCIFRHGPAPLKEAIEASVRHRRNLREQELRVRDEVNELIRASERVRALVNVSVADVVFSLRVEGSRFRFSEVNPAFTSATGLSAETVIGQFVEDIIPEPSRSLVLWKYREAVAQRRTIRWDEVTDYPTGRKYGQVSVTPIIDADGHCTTLVGTVHDVTAERQQSETIHHYADIVDAAQIGLTLWHLEPETLRLLLAGANLAAERLLGLPLGGSVGKSIDELTPPVTSETISTLLRQVEQTGQVQELPQLRIASAGEHVFRLRAFSLSSGTMGLAFEDITEQARNHAMNATEKRILEMVASGATLEDTLTELVVDIERQAPPALGSILLLSQDGDHVRHGAAPHLPAVYSKAIDGLRIGPSAGSCGTAMFTKRSVIVSDIEHDPRWENYREAARPHSLRACWSTPIMSTAGRVLGSFALYYQQPRVPSQLDLDLISRATHVAGIAIQRSQLDEQLRELSHRIEAAREEERTGIARELHDQLGQSLTALKMQLAWVKRRATDESLSTPTLIEKTCESMRMTDELINQIRRISSELRPPMLDDIGLLSALRWQAEDFERRTGIVCAVSPFRSDGLPRKLASLQARRIDGALRSSTEESESEPNIEREVGTAVFRVFQEALTNVARHAGARRVDVRIIESAGQLTLEVQDDGRGMRGAEQTSPWSLGLLGIRERARRLGGTVSFTSVQPHGTLVSLRLPVGPVAAERKIAQPEFAT